MWLIRIVFVRLIASCGFIQFGFVFHHKLLVLSLYNFRICIGTDIERWLPDICVCFVQRSQCLWDIADSIECLFDMIDNELSRYLIIRRLLDWSHVKEIILYCLLYIDFLGVDFPRPLPLPLPQPPRLPLWFPCQMLIFLYCCYHSSPVRFWLQFGLYQI